MSNLDYFVVGLGLGYLTLGVYALCLWLWDKYRYWRQGK